MDIGTFLNDVFEFFFGSREPSVLSENQSLALLDSCQILGEVSTTKLTGEKYKIEPGTVVVIRFRPLMRDGVDLIVRGYHGALRILYQRGIPSATRLQQQELKGRIKNALRLCSLENPRGFTEEALINLRERLQLFQFPDRVSRLFKEGKTPQQIIMILEGMKASRTAAVLFCKRWVKMDPGLNPDLANYILEFLGFPPTKILKGGNKNSIKRSYKRKNKRKNKTRKYRK